MHTSNTKNNNQRLGIDIGGSGIKGAMVDVDTGNLCSERIRMKTPRPATPEAFRQTILTIATSFKYEGPVGVAFPAVIQRGIVHTAVNIDQSWVGQNAAFMFSKYLNAPVSVLNDADAAGLAEMRFGRGSDVPGTVIMVTIGTGLGTALFYDGQLVPNTEFGQMYIKEKLAESWVSDKIRKSKDLSWKKWAKRLDKYLQYLEDLIYPELFIIGGGASKKMDKFQKHFKHVQTDVVPAYLENHAGIIGAAVETVRETP